MNEIRRNLRTIRAIAQHPASLANTAELLCKLQESNFMSDYFLFVCHGVLLPLEFKAITRLSD